MKKLKFFGIFLLFILFAYCVPKVEGGSDDETNDPDSANEGGEGSGTQESGETEVNQVINEAGEGSGTQEGGNNRKWKSATNRKTVMRRERKKKLKEAITASQGGLQPHHNQGLHQVPSQQPMVGLPQVAVYPGNYAHMPQHFTPIQEPVQMPVMYGMPIHHVQGQMPYMPEQHQYYPPQGFNNKQIYHKHIPIPTVLFTQTYTPNEELTDRLTRDQLLQTQVGTSQPSNQSRRSGGGSQYRNPRGGRQHRPHGSS